MGSDGSVAATVITVKSETPQPQAEGEGVVTALVGGGVVPVAPVHDRRIHHHVDPHRRSSSAEAVRTSHRGRKLGVRGTMTGEKAGDGVVDHVSSNLGSRPRRCSSAARAPNIVPGAQHVPGRITGDHTARRVPRLRSGADAFPLGSRACARESFFIVLALLCAMTLTAAAAPHLRLFRPSRSASSGSSR